MLAGKPDVLPLLVLVRQLGGPVGRRRAVAEEFLGRESDHRAEGWIDVGDASLKIARPQACDQRVLHRLAKRQRLGQVMFRPQAPPHVPAEQHQHRHQRDRHGRHQGGEHVREQVGRAAPAIHAQHQRVAREVQQLLGREDPVAAASRAVHRQPGAVGLGERHFLASRQRQADQSAKDLAERIGGDGIADGLAARHQGQAQLHDLQAEAVDLRHEVAAGIRGAADAPCVGAGQCDVGLRILPAQQREHRRPVGRVRGLARGQRPVSPFQSDQLAVFAQQGLRLRRPLAGRPTARLQCLQALHVAGEGRADVAERVGGIAVEFALELAGLVTAGQPDQRHQQCRDQGAQESPERPAPVGRQATRNR